MAIFSEMYSMKLNTAAPQGLQPAGSIASQPDTRAMIDPSSLLAPSPIAPATPAIEPPVMIHKPRTIARAAKTYDPVAPIPGPVAPIQPESAALPGYIDGSGRLPDLAPTYNLHTTTHQPEEKRPFPTLPVVVVIGAMVAYSLMG